MEKILGGMVVVLFVIALASKSDKGEDTMASAGIGIGAVLIILTLLGLFVAMQFSAAGLNLFDLAQ